MGELVKGKIDQMQMDIIRQASNVEEVQSVLGIFAQMRELANQLPEGGVGSSGGKKRGRKAGSKNKEQQKG